MLCKTVKLKEREHTRRPVQVLHHQHCAAMTTLVRKPMACCHHVQIKEEKGCWQEGWEREKQREKDREISGSTKDGWIILENQICSVFNARLEHFQTIVCCVIATYHRGQDEEREKSQGERERERGEWKGGGCETVKCWNRKTEGMKMDGEEKHSWKTG